MAKKKTPKQIAKEKEEEEARIRLARTQSANNPAFKEMTLEERRRAEERANLALTADLFGEAPPIKDEAPPNQDNSDMAAVGVPLPQLEKKAGIGI